MTGMKGAAMAKGEDAARPIGEGERREASRRRWRYVVTGALFTTGLVIGLLIEDHEGASGTAISGWTPAIALIVGAVFLAAVTIGTIVYNRITDEMERQRNARAAVIGGNAFLIGYPLWYLLWKGGFVAEPVHWIMFLAFLGSMIAGQLWYRLRQG
jgi:hypothetical protein